MDNAVATVPPDPVVIAQQIQALTVNVQELMRQNEELKKRAHPEGSNTLHHRRSRSRHDEEANSLANSKGKDTTEYTGQSTPDNDHLMKNLQKELDEGLSNTHINEEDQLGRQNPLFHEHKRGRLELNGDIDPRD
nr:hypothetical protein CFP56_40666 [Quercus suber]